MTPLTEDVYYGRHFRLPGFSAKTQQSLRDAKVLIVGVGGLGCPAALYLAGAGVGTIALCDADVVSATNLHRQVLFDSTTIGKKKVQVAAERLRAINPFISVLPLDMFATPELLATLVQGFDLVLDGTDNFSAKFAINDACEAAGVPLVYGSIFQFEGQVSVFHLKTANGAPGYSYRDLFPSEPPPGLSQNCGEAGVVGVLPGIVGCYQAAEAVKVLAGLGAPLSGRLLTLDVLGCVAQTLRLTRRTELASPAAIDASDSISREDCLARADKVTLLDVRELSEREQFSLGGLHIPLKELPARLAEIPVGQDLVVYCKSGARSARAALYLRSVRPSGHTLNLRGGVDAWTAGTELCALPASR